MGYLVLDLETSTYSSYGRKANPFDERNYIVSWGLKYQDGRKLLTHLDSDIKEPPNGWLDGVDCIVGINLKFDLHFIWTHKELQDFFKRGGRIYDCQYARYLVTAQQHKWASMDQMSEIYGGTQKEDKIKQYWQAGVQTIDIPKEELLEYLDYDLENTDIIFAGVRKEAQQKGMVKTIRQHMEGLCGTIEMEYNGLKIDQETAKRNQGILEKQLEKLSKDLEQYVPKMPDGCEFNWASGDHLSALLFGGVLKYDVKEHQKGEDGKLLYATKTVKEPVKDARGNPVRFKSGAKKGEIKYRNVKMADKERPKMKKITKEFRLRGLTKPRNTWALAKEGVYKTDAKVLEILATERQLPVCKVLMEYKKHTKDLGTYYQQGNKGMLTLVQSGDIIHHQLNNVQTETGRLSSSKPNMQNLPRGNTSEVFGGVLKYDVKEHQKGEDGKLLYATKTVKEPVKDARGNPVRFKSGAKKGEIKYRNVKMADKERPKMKKITKEFRLRGLTKPRNTWALAKEGVYKTDAKVLEILATERQLPVCKVLMEYKKHTKDLGTYYQQGNKGMLTLVQSGDIIHHQLNNVQTETGRLSSSKPNMQNLPRGNTSEVREMFTSRFADGRVAEIDYGQLEVVVQAILTRDDNLIADVNAGVDFHCKRLAVKLHEDYEDVLRKCKVDKDPWYDLERTKAKGFSFQRAYGAGKKAIAAATGMPEDEVQTLIDVEEKLYPKVGAYNRWAEATVKKNKVPTEEKSFRGYTRHFGWHSSPTGKRYGFTEYDAPDFLVRNGTMTSFKPTEIKNYSVQGAAGEMVLAMIGKLWRHFVANGNYGGKALLVNTVHK